MSEIKKDLTNFSGLVFRGILENAEPRERGKSYDKESKQDIEWGSAINLNFTVFVPKTKIVQGSEVTYEQKSTVVITDECDDEQLISKLAEWQKHEKKTIAIQLQLQKNFKTKVLEVL